MQVPAEWYDADSASSSSSRPTSPAAYCCRIRAFSSFGRPDVIGPAGTKTVGRWPKDSAPISMPGTILSQTPSISVASNMSCDSAIAVDIAITSRLNSDSCMPVAALGDPVAHRGHAAGELRDAAGAHHGLLELGRERLERLVRREHVVVGRDDRDVRLHRAAQRRLVDGAGGREAVRQVGAGQPAAGRAAVGGGVEPLEVRRALGSAALDDAGRDLRDDGMHVGHECACISCQERPSRSRRVIAALGPLVPAG